MILNIKYDHIFVVVVMVMKGFSGCDMMDAACERNLTLLFIVW